MHMLVIWWRKRGTWCMHSTSKETCRIHRTIQIIRKKRI